MLPLHQRSVEWAGLEPAASCLQDRRSTVGANTPCSAEDSNLLCQWRQFYRLVRHAVVAGTAWTVEALLPAPPGCKPGALLNELTVRSGGGTRTLNLAGNSRLHCRLCYP